MSPASRPVQPSAAGAIPLTPFLVLGAAWAAVVLAWLAWAAGRVTAWLTDHPAGPAFDAAFVRDVLRGDWPAAYPLLNLTAVAASYTVLVAAVAAAAVTGWLLWTRRRHQAGDPLPSLARLDEVADLTPAAVAVRARQLRPSLANVPAKRLDPAATGVALGTMLRHGRHRRHGPVLRASWEDGILALMGPRAGKTTAIAVPAILQAPGAVLATSNRTDVWATTHAARAKAGRVWVFDPQAITRTGQHWWWNPLTAIRSVEDAARMAAHFIQPIRRDKGEDFWLAAAEDLLTSFFLAAAVGGVAMADVQAWLADAADDEPVGLLFDHGYPEVARALRGRQHGAPETRDGIYETARTTAKCLQDPAIMAWVNQPTGIRLPQFDPDELPVSTDTLYLLSKDGAGSSGPLVAALTDQVMRHGVRRAEANGGRLDPPMLAMLDEAANICPLADLPQLYSHYGGRGIVLVTILQTYQQGTTVWGQRGMATLWGAATVKLVGAGGDDPRFAADVSTLIGEHDVAVLALTRDATGHTSRQISVRRQRIMGPEHVRALRRGTAILLAAGARPAMLELAPWYRRPDAAQLAADTATAVAQIAAAAERNRLTADLATAGLALPTAFRGLDPDSDVSGSGSAMTRPDQRRDTISTPHTLDRGVPPIPRFRGPARQP